MSHRYDSNDNNNKANTKRNRDQEEQLQTLQFQQRSAAARALERLKKTEGLKPIDRLVLLFNLHFQRRDAPSYRVVAESPLRVLHPQFFEFVSPSEWIARHVAEDELPELLLALDDIVESHRAVMGSGDGGNDDGDEGNGSNNKRRDTNSHHDHHNKPQQQKPLHPGNADGTVGWGDEEEEDDGNTFSNLLGDGAEENAVFAATEEERDALQLEAFWGLVAECVEATQKYREVRDALGAPTPNAAINNGKANNANANNTNANPLLSMFAAMNITVGGNSNSNAAASYVNAGAAPDNRPTINMTALSASGAAPAAGGAADAVTGVVSTTANNASSSSSSSAAAAEYASFYGYTHILKEAAAITAGIPIADLQDAQRYLTAMAAIPTASTTAAVVAAGGGGNGLGFLGPQSHFIYRLALSDCTQRLARFHLDCFVRLYRKGREGGDPVDPIAEASAECDRFVQAVLEACGAMNNNSTSSSAAGGSGGTMTIMPTASDLQKLQLQWQYQQYQLQYPQLASSFEPPAAMAAILSSEPVKRLTAAGGATAAAAGGGGGRVRYVLPPIPAFAVAEAEEIRQKRLELLNQRGAARTDNAQEYLKNGFGVDYIPSEDDFIRAMANDDRTAIDGGEEGDENGPSKKPIAAGGEGGGAGGGFDEGESLFKEEIHNYYISHLLKEQQRQQGGGAAAQQQLSLVTADGKPRFIKPVRYCRVKTGYVWNAYNRAKYSLKSNNEKPPQVVQWYEFVLFFPLVVGKVKSPQDLFRVELTDKGDEDSHRILVFSAGAPYADVAYKIVNDQWDRRRGGVRCSIDDKGKFRLFFRLASTNYRR